MPFIYSNKIQPLQSEHEVLVQPIVEKGFIVIIFYNKAFHMKFYAFAQRLIVEKGFYVIIF